MVKIDKTKLNLINRTKKIFTRQKSPKVYDVTTVAYVMSTKFIKEKSSIFEGKLEYNIIPKHRSIDIDDKIDFKFAEFLHQKNGSNKFLKKNIILKVKIF